MAHLYGVYWEFIIIQNMKAETPTEMNVKCQHVAITIDVRVLSVLKKNKKKTIMMMVKKTTA